MKLPMLKQALSQVRTGGNSNDVSSQQLKYLVNTDINGRELTLSLDESKALEGGQAWDLNPLIFYRVRSNSAPNINFVEAHQLSKIELHNHFPRTKQKNKMVSFTVRKA